jgi:hypothetical protein
MEEHYHQLINQLNTHLQQVSYLELQYVMVLLSPLLGTGALLYYNPESNAPHLKE